MFYSRLLITDMIENKEVTISNTLVKLLRKLSIEHFWNI